MIECSVRLKNVKRVLDPYTDRRDFVRLDRNEDPQGYDQVFFDEWRNTLTPHDIAAYSDAKNFITKLALWLKAPIEEIFLSNGSDAVIKTIFEVYVNQGDNVLLLTPSWRMYDVYADIYGAQVHFVNYDQNLNVDFSAILDAVNVTDLRMVVLAHPNQPTGTLFAREDIEALLHITHKKNVIVVIDEAYHLFSQETYIDYIHKYPNLIITRTFSKAFGCAGLRLGYAVACEDRIKDLKLLRAVTDSNSLALHFGEFLLDHMDIVQDKIKNFIEGREYLYLQLLKAQIDVKHSSGNFILIPCLSLDAAHTILEQCKEKKYLLKGPFTKFPLENYIRVTIGPLSLMKQFWGDCMDIIARGARKKIANEQ